MLFKASYRAGFIPTLSIINSHFVDIDQMGIDKAGIDEVGIDEVGELDMFSQYQASSACIS